MEDQLVWKEEFNIGIKIIDEEHQKLFKIINKLFALGNEEQKGRRAIQEGIKYFKEHALNHFQDEEKYMELIAYDELETHRRLHRGFRDNSLPALEKELRREDYSPDSVEHFLAVCAGWLIGHTLTEDMAITGEKMSKWVGLLPEEELAAVEKVIIKTLKNMFQLKAQVISDTYGGEKFGKAVYYRLAYAGKKGERWEIILGFEEKLLLKTIGSMMNIDSEEVNVMVINIARYMAQQFVHRISEQYPASAEYEMKDEKLLNYEQFRKNLDREKPQASLLFDTGEGYFAYCVIAPHLFENEAEGTTIKAENAMSEIQNYLNENDVSRKKKILVVDDSEVVRRAMRDLLGKDYAVEAAKSGIAAIKCMTLGRPDLVLLDYEMPICDGSVVLEMMRSEEEFADIPVYFLTGNVSKESVQKVIPLKPMGYLVKTLKPEEIKKNIDDYFKKKER